MPVCNGLGVRFQDLAVRGLVQGTTPRVPLGSNTAKKNWPTLGVATFGSHDTSRGARRLLYPRASPAPAATGPAPGAEFRVSSSVSGSYSGFG